MAAIEAEGLRRTYRTHTGTLRRRAKDVDGVADYAPLRRSEVLSRRHALERT